MFRILMLNCNPDSFITPDEPTRTLYEQSKSAINRRFCYNMEKDSVKLIVKAHE